MTFLLVALVLCMWITDLADIRWQRKHGRDIQLYIAGDATDERVDYIAERIAGAIRR